MEFSVASEGVMKAFGATFGALLKGGEIIELVGDVGAGKTTFTKGLALGMGVTEDVQSPTFTISRIYDTPSHVQLAHYDFYRLHDAGIMANELYDTLHDSKTVIIIEWAEIVSGVLPTDHITITITAPTDVTRYLVFSSGGEYSHKLLEKIHDSIA
jgi:tRNA threonylcarbamoyladenosine biosynthesis protein TsaE